MKPSTNPTVREAQASKFLANVRDGKSLTKAAEEAGTTLAVLRRSGGLAGACRELLERADEGKVLDREIREKLVKARLIELALQDTNLNVAVNAARQIETELGLGDKTQIAVGVQVNQVSPALVEALKSLKPEVEDEMVETVDS